MSSSSWVLLVCLEFPSSGFGWSGGFWSPLGYHLIDPVAVQPQVFVGATPTVAGRSLFLGFYLKLPTIGFQWKQSGGHDCYLNVAFIANCTGIAV